MELTNAEKFTLRQKISDYAKSIGFDLVGFSPAKIEEKYLVAFEDWLKNGREGTMEYMQKIEQRRDLTKILPDAKSVIVFGMNYFHKQKALARGHGRVARYAYGRDYHKIIGKKLKKIEKFIAEQLELTPGISQPKICHANCTTNLRLPIKLQKSARADFYAEETVSASHFGSEVPPRGGHTPELNVLTKSDAKVSPRRDVDRGDRPPCRAVCAAYVDTGPILERALAEQSGIGRIGKNGCVISKEFGSWIFLSEIITTLDLNFAAISPATTDRWSDPTQKSFNVCGNCTRCMTACPTGAIIAPGVVDSRLCISYLTIENKEKIPPALAKIIKKTKRLYGCDICQEVCPHNDARAKIPTAPQDGLFTPIAGDSLDIKKLLAKKSILSSDEAFLKTFAGSPVMRAKRKGLKRTTEIF